MKRAWKISDAVQSELLFLRIPSKTLISPPPSTFTLTRYPSLSRTHNSSSSSTAHLSSALSNILSLFINKLSISDIKSGAIKETARREILELRDELVSFRDDPDHVVRVLEDRYKDLVKESSGESSHGATFIELLRQLASWPPLAMQVFIWRRKAAENGLPLTSEEYAKGIAIAGRMKDIDLAHELFTEAANKRVRTTSAYNALMGAYMMKGLIGKCQSAFVDLKRDANCKPSIVSYNILISLFGRFMLVDHMETAFKELENLNLSPNLSTFNHLIDGYMTAWMWDDMERTFQMMKNGPIQPDITTYSLMLRGYAHSGNLEKMEDTYELIKDHVDKNEIPLIRSMICAYCKSSVRDRVEKIESLLRLIPENDYRPWLNVLMIVVYAKEDWLEKMENSINMAFEHQVTVNTVGIMRAIVSSYFRCNALDRLVNFVKRAECAGWRLCRSLYHCKMAMYGSQKRLKEMERVIYEMEKFNFNRTKKTFIILFKAYLSCGEIHKLEQVKGLMCTHGYGDFFQQSPFIE